MKGLEEYTTEQLKAEIRRREAKVEKAKEEKPKFAELTGVVTHVSKPYNSCKVADYHFRVKFDDAELFAFPRVQKWQNNFEYYHIKKGIKRKDLPKEGDKVVVRSQINDFLWPFNDSNSEIIKVIR